ncbi:MAG: hypothetical protein A2408_02660 [Candidatus Yonathbacteria bacterium RIFOXYC1_FULL_52_10]|uniref:UDP-N-acetylglucosamine 2-epimerase domain-containing protein n=1 Tax=Candidatus Yonathbacteria bacterium RIFOXYD1_FULL_52_36 TaxID=1802730 RepID=A0A1G2SL13_9BACT|nr:MAG: hypothetical protein A2408_02660 [Candidatus Yonathbacteria bacterium RIFOXYC1_FULL_52_10]OHA85686.1 MAG: hypothetical protein A2591_02530 [Candidatus Yonathbacteria bacterium RIFOXYD1_FULL_52_36]
MKRDALLVTKDIGGVRVVCPLADALKHDGWSTRVIAEGKSLPLWRETGHTLLVGGQLAQPLDIDAAEVILRSENPGVVITTLGSPINLEDAFSHAANRLDIPLVWFPDVWGAETRSQAIPDIVFAFDETERLVLEGQPRFEHSRIEVVGHPLADEMLAGPSDEAQRIAVGAHIENSTIILIAGQGEYTGDMIDFVANSIAHFTEGKFIIIPRFHPKYKDDKPEWIAAWRERLDAIQDAAVIEVDPRVSTDDLARVADITVSSFSTTLTYAALAGKIPISVTTPAARAAMVKSTGLDHYPPTRIGAAIEATEPMHLALDSLRKKLGGQEAFSVEAFDARRAIRVIKGLALRPEAKVS